jgi:ankyrin repeat protein
VDNEGGTALHIAAQRCDAAVVKYLVKHGAKALSQNIIFTACVGSNKPSLTAIFGRLKQDRPKRAKKTVRRLLPELLAELCSAGPVANSTAFPFLMD